MTSKKSNATYLIVSMMAVAFTSFAQEREPVYRRDTDSADFYLRAHRHDKALTSYRKSFKNGNVNPYDYYNAGCSASLTGNSNEAFTFLTKSIALGYLDEAWMMKDSDLEPLRGKKQWTALMERFQKQQDVIAKMFSKIGIVDPAHLIPFQKDGLWGYLDKTTRAVLVKPAFRELGFMNGCALLYYRDRCGIRISPKGEVLEVIYPNHDNYELIGIDHSDEMAPKSVGSADGFKGFKLDSENQITVFSDIYNRFQPSFFNVEGPFMINGRYYIIAHQQERSGVIDQEGNPLRHFNFVHKKLTWNRWSVAELKWFYFTDDDDKNGFISESGEIRLYDEMIDYPFNSTDRFNFNIQRGRETSGILDYEKMEWLIKPQPLKITAIYATHTAGCKEDTNNRSKLVELYFFVQEGNAGYYIDKNLNAFKPK
jgi:hypothetical protein